MSMISEQVKELRKIAFAYGYTSNRDMESLLRQAADTIESLSAKLQAANMERTADAKMIDGNKLLKDLEKETFTADLYEHGWDGQTVDYLLCLGDVKKVIDGYEQSAEDCGGWILCSERMPDNNRQVICCFRNGIVRVLVFLNHKFHSTAFSYEKSDIIAWQPLPEPYHEP